MATESELLRIKKDLKARAKKLHLGKARTGAYVYGTLRKIRGNPKTLWVVVKGGEAINDNAYDKRSLAEKMARAHRARVMTLKQYEMLRKVRGNPAPFKKIKNLPDTDMAEELFSYFDAPIPAI